MYFGGVSAESPHRTASARCACRAGPDLQATVVAPMAGMGMRSERALLRIVEQGDQMLEPGRGVRAVTYIFD